MHPIPHSRLFGHAAACAACRAAALVPEHHRVCQAGSTAFLLSTGSNFFLGCFTAQPTMAAVGLDIGDLNMVVAVARRAGVDILLNQESKRETPALINFSEKQVCHLYRYTLHI